MAIVIRSSRGDLPACIRALDFCWDNQHKQKMLDIPDNAEMTQERFIHSCARMMANWGMPLTAARVLAYLFLQSKPAGHDQIAADLGMSKAGAWAATRHLEQVKQLERFAEPGSKRALYLPKEDIAHAMFNYSRLMGQMGVLMRQGAEVASGEAGAERLRVRSELYGAVHDAIEDTMAAFLTSRRRAAAG